MAKGNGKTNGSTRGSRKRRGSGENFTGAEENKTEVRKAELDLKPVEIDDGDFDMHLKSVKAATEKLTTAQGLLRSCYKAAKKVSPQLLDALKYALKAERADAEDIKRELEVMGYVLKKTNAPIQITLHDTLLGDENELAAKRGYQNGKNGTGMNCPYPEGSDLASLYADAYMKGQADLIGGSVGDRIDATDFPGPDHNERNGIGVEDSALA